MRSPRLLLVLVALLSSTACVTDEVSGPDDQITTGSFTVDASVAWRYVSLGDSALVAPAPSATESSDWDIAFNATNVTLNGGAAGPGGIEAACICQNAAATNDEVLAMTAESELADFDAVAAVPAGLTWMSDQLTPAIAGWFAGTGAAATAVTDKSWLVRLSSGQSYALVRVSAITAASATSAGRVTLEYAVQANTASPLGALQTIEVDLTTPGAKGVDLDAGALTTTTDWDVRLEGFTIRVNGGVSGPGSAAAAVNTEAFAATTTAVTQPNAYRSDVYAGIFGTSPWYRYNILGDHAISPTFNVYLVRRADVTYKVQLTSYYNATGAPRHISFRWERLGE
jgi:hypothetical protein